MAGEKGYTNEQIDAVKERLLEARKNEKMATDILISDSDEATKEQWKAIGQEEARHFRSIFSKETSNDPCCIKKKQ